MRYGIFCMIVCAFYSVLGQTWTGNVNADWNNPSNWSTVPGNGDDITINPANYTGAMASPIITSNSNFSPAQVLISNGAVLTISANLTTQDDVEVIGTGTSLIMTNGVFNVNINDGGRLIFDLGATMLMDGGNVNVGERFIAGEDAVVTVNAGSVTSGERLLMDLGGHIIQNGGSVSTAQTFAMADGNVNGNSSYTLNDGNLTITGEMALENESGNFEPTFTQNGGTLIVNGDLFWFGEAPGTGTPRCLFNSGSATFNGIIENMPASTVNMYFKMSGDAVVTFTGSRWEMVNPLDSVIGVETSFLILQNTNDVINTGAWHFENASTHFRGVTGLIGNGNYQFHNVAINGNNASNTLNHITNSPIHISGDFYNLNSFNPNNNGVIFNGEIEQQLSSEDPIQFFNLEINNSSNTGVSIVSGIGSTYSILNHLELTDGLLYIEDSETLQILDNATTNEGNLSSFVHGAITKIGNDAFVFPIGKGVKWSRMWMSSPSSNNVTSAFRAEYFDETYTSISPVNAPISSVSNVEYWQFDQTNGSDNVEIRLYWEDASSSVITDCNELSIANWDGSSWNNVLSTASGLCTGQNAGDITSNSVVSGFGAFTFGFYNGVTTQNIILCQGESFSVGTSTYTTSGTYVDVLQDQSMNDSTVITHIVVNNPIAVIQNNVAELYTSTNPNFNYQWINCEGSILNGEDSYSFTPTVSGNFAVIVTEGTCVDTSDCLIYTIIDTTICNGSEYEIGNSAYNANGTYSDLFTISGNDSLVISNLTVFAPNISTNTMNETITANNSNASYLWMNCNDYSFDPININQSFTPIENGSYAVQITENGCVDTSDCVVISTVGLNDDKKLDFIRVYPNPFTENISLVFAIETEANIIIRDIQGKVINELKIMSDTQTIDTQLYSPGIYFIEVRTNEGKEVWKLLKE